MAKNLNIVFLGGVGEIGKNMTALEYGDNILVVDAGLSFASSELPGVNFIIPDFSYLEQNKEKVKGVVVTHGHEDHIGALPYFLGSINVPVYGSNLTIGLLQHKLKEQKLTNVNCTEVSDRDVITIGAFRVEFIRVTHSIAGAFALSIETPKGVVFFTGDFKIDHTPIDNRRMDLSRIAEIGSKGVLLLLQDSTNVERPGYTMSEKTVGQKLDAIFAQNINKRIIVATFASNIHRVQQIINCALKYNRRVVFSGRSMENIAQIAHDMHELNYPQDKIVSADKINGIPYDKLCIISTGTQGEPEAVLARMGQGQIKNIKITDTDTVILSSSPIPGNEKSIYNVINNLYKLGANVIYKDLAEVHVSGHACQEELKMMMALLKPKYFMPVHGEYRQLMRHARLAVEIGIPNTNILVPQLGDSIMVSKAGLKKATTVKSGTVMLDVTSTEDSVETLRDRQHLAEDGFVVAFINLALDGSFITAPTIITKGISLTEKLQEELRDAITTKVLSAGSDSDDTDVGDINSIVRSVVAKFIFKATKRRPLVVPITISN